MSSLHVYFILTSRFSVHTQLCAIRLINSEIRFYIILIMLTQNYFCSLFKSNTYISMLFNYIFIIFFVINDYLYLRHSYVCPFSAVSCYFLRFFWYRNRNVCNFIDKLIKLQHRIVKLSISKGRTLLLMNNSFCLYK